MEWSGAYKLDKFQTTKDQTALAGLTKHNLTGAIMQAGVQSYFAVNQAQDLIAQKQAGIVSNPKLSYGTFSTDLKTEYRYGIAWRTSPKGLMMDIDHILKQTIDKDNSNDKVIAFNRSTGVRESLNENLIPEQLFDDPKTTEKEAQGISAVKALQLAAQQGQTIYTITQANYAQILPKLNHADDVMRDVSNAINAGKEVTISQTQVHAFGWSGSGYIILDPSNGTGAYMIGGGADGGFVYILGSLVGFLSMAAISITIPALALALSNPIIFGLLVALTIATIFMLSVAIANYRIYSDTDNELAKCFLGGFLNGLTLGGIFPIGKYLVSFLIAILSTIANSELDTNNFKTCRGYP